MPDFKARLIFSREFGNITAHRIVKAEPSLFFQLRNRETGKRFGAGSDPENRITVDRQMLFGVPLPEEPLIQQFSVLIYQRRSNPDRSVFFFYVTDQLCKTFLFILCPAKHTVLRLMNSFKRLSFLLLSSQRTGAAFPEPNSHCR